MRHRIASYSQQSQRYVKEHDFETIMPPTISSRPEAKAKFEQLMADIQARYNEFTDEFGIPQRMPVMYFLMRLKLKLWQHLMSGL